MARTRRRRRSTKSLSAMIRKSFSGFYKVGISTIVMSAGAYLTSVMSGKLTITFGDTTFDLGFIPGLIVVGAGIFILISALRDIAHTKI